MTEEGHRGNPEKRKLERGKTTVRKSRRKSRHQWLNRIVLFTVLLLLAGGGFAAKTHWTAIQAQWDILPDANARHGTLYGETPRDLEGGSFWVLVNQLPTMEEGSRSCKIRYENPASNHYSARISLYSVETGELLGHTRRVDPGNYVETIQIQQKLPIGEYPVRANLELFQDKTPAGNLSLDMSLRVVQKEPDTENQDKESGTG